ncbi:MAG: hypothetical protein AAB361_02555 [Patescibacteria group bacterium]
MKEAKKSLVNRFGNYPKNPDQSKEEKVKRILLTVAEKRRANKAIGSLLAEFKGRYSLLQLLPLIKRRYPFLLPTAIERVERQKNRNELKMEKIIEFEAFKDSLKQEI